MVDIDTSRILKHKILNLIHSIVLLSGMIALLSFLGWSIAGDNGLKWTIFMGILMFLLAPRISPSLILFLYGARPLSTNEVPALYTILKELCRRAGLKYVPQLYYIPTQIPNAFTTGKKDNAVITVTAGLLNSLSLREITAVLAHEVSHIWHNDLWIMNLSDVISRLTFIFSVTGQFLLLLNLPFILFTSYKIPWLPVLILIFAPTINMLLQLALSRTREFDADLGAAILTGDPEGLAMALEKMERYQSGIFSRLFFPGYKDPQPSLLRTHPSTEERIKRLMSLVKKKPLYEPLYNLVEYFVPDYLTNAGTKPRWRIGGLWY